MSTDGNTKNEPTGSNITIYLASSYNYKEHIITINGQANWMVNEFRYDYVIHGRKFIFTPKDNDIFIKRADDDYLYTTMVLPAKTNITIDVDGKIE